MQARDRNEGRVMHIRSVSGVGMRQPRHAWAEVRQGVAGLGGGKAGGGRLGRELCSNGRLGRRVRQASEEKNSKKR